MNHKDVFFQITKVDEQKRLVTGRATDETPDKADEIFDYESSKPHFQAWSEEVAKDSGGKSKGNVRSMHGKVAAGKLMSLNFDDAAKTIDVTAKVVDDNEWNKVLEGVHTGFSIGGSYIGDKWEDKAHAGKMRYTAKPSEISLVDRPCNPTALFFDVQKADGTVVQQAFKPVVVTGEMIGDEMSRMLQDGSLSLADMLAAIQGAKAAKSDPGGKEAVPVVKTEVVKDESELPTPQIGNLVNFMWGSNAAQGVITEITDGMVSIGSTGGNGEPFVCVHAESLKHVPADNGPINWSVGQMPTKMFSHGQLVKAEAEAVEKEDWDTYILARLLTDLGSMQKEANDADTQAWLEKGIDLFMPKVAPLKKLVGEPEGEDKLSKQAHEIIKLTQERYAEFEKVGARNSKADMETLQNAHDCLNKMGAACSSDYLKQQAEDDDDAGKVAAKVANSLGKGIERKLDEVTTQLEKMAGERDSLLQQLTKVTVDFQAVQERLKVVEASPAAPKGKLLVVGKSEDYARQEGSPQDDMAQFLVYDDQGKVNQAATMFKYIQAKHAQPASPNGLVNPKP